MKRKSPSDAGNRTATVFQKCQIPRVYSLSPRPQQESKHLPLLESRDTVFLFVFIFFLPPWFQEVKQELKLFLRSVLSGA